MKKPPIPHQENDWFLNLGESIFILLVSVIAGTTLFVGSMGLHEAIQDNNEHNVGAVMFVIGVGIALVSAFVYFCFYIHLLDDMGAHYELKSQIKIAANILILLAGLAQLTWLHYLVVLLFVKGIGNLDQRYMLPWAIGATFVLFMSDVAVTRFLRVVHQYWKSR